MTANVPSYLFQLVLGKATSDAGVEVVAVTKGLFGSSDALCILNPPLTS
jgi:hypothetical protein